MDVRQRLLSAGDEWKREREVRDDWETRSTPQPEQGEHECAYMKALFELYIEDLCMSLFVRQTLIKI